MYDERSNLPRSSSSMQRARPEDAARLRLAAHEVSSLSMRGSETATKTVVTPTLSQYYPPVTDALDPRWVLATRVAEQLQGEVIGPERRERLLKIGTMLGLSRFDACLVIAIVQDQARRGVRPEQCAASAEPQLRMIGRPDAYGAPATPLARRWSVTVAWLAAIVIVEFVLLRMFM